MGREITQMRGTDYDDPVDWEVGDIPPHYRRSFAPQPTHAQLVSRPFVSKPLYQRCWCGRPLKDSTGHCLLQHP
jgi:hypothetical protein